MLEQLAPYSGSIIGLMITGIIILILGPAVGAKKASAAIKPGSEPENDYGDANYRLHRSHMNAVENYAQFAIPALFAMLLGASVTWVAVLVWATVIARLAYTFIYPAEHRPAGAERAHLRLCHRLGPERGDGDPGDCRGAVARCPDANCRRAYGTAGVPSGLIEPVSHADEIAIGIDDIQLAHAPRLGLWPRQGAECRLSAGPAVHRSARALQHRRPGGRRRDPMSRGHGPGP